MEKNNAFTNVVVINIFEKYIYYPFIIYIILGTQKYR